MKILVSILSILLFLPSLFSIVSADSGLGFQVLKYNPTPAEPGNFLEIFVSVTKNSGEDLRNHVIEILPEYPFFPAASEDSRRIFSKLDSNGAIVRFELRVAEDVTSGEYFLKIRNRPLNSELNSGFVRLPISILSKIEVSIDNITPNNLIPAKLTNVTFNFKNSGKAPINDLLITWNNPENKIFPIGSDNRYRIKNIGINESMNVIFPMIADPNINQGIHVIDINMEFERFGESENIISKIAFVVGGTTDYNIAQSEFSNNLLSLSIANIGVNIATGVLISIPEQEDWEIIGAGDIFLGNLQPGDFTVGSVNIIPNILNTNQNLKVLIYYTDTVGTRQFIEKNVPINLINETEQKNDKSLIDPLTVFIVLIIVGIFLYSNKRFNLIKKIKKIKK